MGGWEGGREGGREGGWEEEIERGIKCTYTHADIQQSVCTCTRVNVQCTCTHTQCINQENLLIHQCYVRMTCNTPTPGHPSAADDAW